jgi:hypothetical protein
MWHTFRLIKKVARIQNKIANTEKLQDYYIELCNALMNRFSKCERFAVLAFNFSVSKDIYTLYIYAYLYTHVCIFCAESLKSNLYMQCPFNPKYFSVYFKNNKFSYTTSVQL